MHDNKATTKHCGEHPMAVRTFCNRQYQQHNPCEIRASTQQPDGRQPLQLPRHRHSREK